MKVDNETAAQELNRFLEAMDLAHKTVDLSDEDRQSFEGVRNPLIRAIMQGALVIDEQGCAVYTPQVSANREPLKFSEPGGIAFLEMDKAKGGGNAERMNRAMSAITGAPLVRFADMKLRDYTVCSAIMALFLAG